MEIYWHCYMLHWLAEISPICPSVVHLEGACIVGLSASLLLFLVCLLLKTTRCLWAGMCHHFLPV